MAGINYGNKYKLWKHYWNKEGVFLIPETNKWIVRISYCPNRYTTMSQHETEDEAQVEYQKHIS